MGFKSLLKLSLYFVHIITDIRAQIWMAPSYLTTQCALGNILFLYIEGGEVLLALFYRSSNLTIAQRAKSQRRLTLPQARSISCIILCTYQQYFEVCAGVQTRAFWLRTHMLKCHATSGVQKYLLSICYAPGTMLVPEIRRWLREADPCTGRNDVLIGTRIEQSKNKDNWI